MCVDPDVPAPDQVAYDPADARLFIAEEREDQVAYDQMIRSMRPPVVTVPLIWEDDRANLWQERLDFMLQVLTRLGFIQHNPREIKTWPIYPTPFMSSWGSIDIAQLEACIKEELSK